MIIPVQSNINFTGKVLIGTLKHEKDAIEAAKLLSTIPKEPQGIILEKIREFKDKYETLTPDGDTLILNLATDIAKDGVLAGFNPPDGVPTCLGMEVLYETAGINGGKNTLWGVLSVSQAEFKTKDKQRTLTGDELRDSISSAFLKMDKYTLEKLVEIKAKPKYQEDVEIRRILDIIG